MVIRGETDAVQREVRIAARQETIFPFFTDPEKMMRCARPMRLMACR